MVRREDEWVWGWDSTPGIVSVWAEIDGRATLWRRIPDMGQLVREEQRFRPWLVLDRLEDLHHLGDRLGPEGCEKALIRIASWMVLAPCATWSPLATEESSSRRCWRGRPGVWDSASPICAISGRNPCSP